MRDTTATWTANQAEDASVPSVLTGFVETRRSKNLLRQDLGALTVAHPGGTGTFGEIIVPDEDLVVRDFTMGLSLATAYNPIADCEVWSYDTSTNTLVTKLGNGAGVVAGGGLKTDVTFTLTADLALSADEAYAVLVFYPAGNPALLGPMLGYYAIGDPYAAGCRVTSVTRTAGTVMTESATEDMVFRIIGDRAVAPTVRRWEVSNDDSVDNAVDATTKTVFDPAGVTLPFESCAMTIENATYADDEEVAAQDYDFTDLINRTALKAPGVVDVSLGYRYDSGSTETLHMTRQRLASVKVSEDEQYVTFTGVSFIDRLADTIFYGGRYDPAGIEAATLFAEILDDAQFPNEGQWNYRIGDAACKVSAAGTRPLWGSNYTYYHIDPTLTTKVYLPIPAVSHRDALTMLAAYCGATMRMLSDGSLDIRAIAAPTVLDYHFDIDRTYDRPETVQGAEIGKITGKLHSFSQGDAEEVIADVTVAVETLNTAEFTITHDGCADGALVLTGATVVGSVTYNTYSTVFVATPAGATFQAVLSGYPVSIRDTAFVRSYPHENGETREYSNPIASDPTLTSAMYDRFYTFETAARYEFGMRDDPAVEVGDYVYLDTLSSPAGIPVLVESIDRTFNGGIDGRYVVVDAALEPYPAPEQPDDTDAANHAADDPQSIGATSIDALSIDSITAFDLGDA